jgi:hypothetical protein
MKVKCASYDYQNNQWAEFDISATMKLYPCCAYHGYYAVNEWHDDNFKNLPPDWNDLTKHDFNTITKKMFAILNVDNFNSGNCPQKCKEVCGVGIQERCTPTRNFEKKYE